MKKFWFLAAMSLSTVCFGQDLVPVPDQMLMTQQQTVGEYFRLCVEIKADLDAADFAAGAAKRHRDSCQADYNAAIQGSVEATTDFMDTMNPYYIIQMNYWAGQVAYHGLRLSSAESALNSAIASLMRFELEYSQKGC